jgi:hypothetical protein
MRVIDDTFSSENQISSIEKANLGFVEKIMGVPALSAGAALRQCFKDRASLLGYYVTVEACNFASPQVLWQISGQ